MTEATSMARRLFVFCAQHRGMWDSSVVAPVVVRVADAFDANGATGAVSGGAAPQTGGWRRHKLLAQQRPCPSTTGFAVVALAFNALTHPSSTVAELESAYFATAHRKNFPFEGKYALAA
jgi:hypothetical protein